VNPLLSVQVTQDEYGDKIVKPLVNLHVTPNHGFVHKLSSILHGFHHKPYYPVYPPFKHDHHHHHIHMSKPHPSYYYPYKPSYHYGAPYKPSYHYAPAYYGYRSENDYYSSGHVSDEEDQYDNENDYVDDPYSSYSRHSRGNQTVKHPSSNSFPSSSSGTGSSAKVQFPSNRRSNVIIRTKRQEDDDTDRHKEVNLVQEVRPHKDRNTMKLTSE